MGKGTSRTLVPLEQELTERVGWFIKLRWFATVGVLMAFLGKVVLQFNLPFLSLCIIVLMMVIYNIAFQRYFSFLSRQKEEQFGNAREREKAYMQFTRIQIVMDWIALGLISHFSGGIQSPILMFFIFHILIASILLTRRDCYLQATLAVCFVTAIALLEYSEIIPHVPLTNAASAQYSDPASIVAILFFFAATLYISVFIATSITAALRSKERSLVLLQADLQEAYNDLEETSEARNRFIVTVTHELRAPLAAVQSMLKVISEGYTGEISPKAKELIVRSENRIVFLLELVNDLLDLAKEKLKIIQRERTDVNLNEVIAEIVDGIQDRAAAKRVSLTTNIPSEHIIMEGDRKDFEELFGNLLSNAVKYTPEGGQANLTAEITEDRVNCTVADTGIGIPEEAIGKLFDEFFRASNAKDVAEYGTGIGLAIVKRIVDEYKGEISVESELGYGTQFSISLPLYTDVQLD